VPARTGWSRSKCEPFGCSGLRPSRARSKTTGLELNPGFTIQPRCLENTMLRRGLLQNHALQRLAVGEAREGLPSRAKRRRSRDGPVQTGPRLSGRGTGPPATEAHREGPVDDSLEHFGPKVHAASIVKIIEVAQTDIPVAEANLHHPFAVPPVPCDTGKAGPVGLGHGFTSMRDWSERGNRSAALCVDWRSYPRRVALTTHRDPGEGIAERSASPRLIAPERPRQALQAAREPPPVRCLRGLPTRAD
jgi:hypothetical protein